MARAKYRMLLVEDSDDDVVLFELALRRTGLHETYELLRRFRNAEEAIEYFTLPQSVVDPEPKPDIVILDVKLPGGSGFDVLTAIRGLEEQPAVAMFTGSALAEEKEKAHTLGADLFQTKNFESTEFSRFLHWLARLANERKKRGE